jgi:uncharacterized protein (DUF2336 family)
MFVDRFFVWVRDAGSEQRRRIVEPMVRATREAAEASETRETLDAALTVLAADPDPGVRRALAESLAEWDEAPRHLLLDLLWDEASVAEVVAARSEALIEAELVEVAAGASADVAFALARRRRVGPTLAGALIESVDRRGAVALLANAAADLGAAALLRLVDRFGEFADVREALTTRPHLPVTVRHRVLEKLAETMGNIVVFGRPGAEARGRALARDAKDRATVALAGTAGDAEVTVLVDHLRHTGQLTTRLVLRAVCIGDLRFVEEALAVLAKVPRRRVAALVADGRESAFRALYRRAAMPERAFPAFAAALEVHRDLLRETGGLDGRPGDRARFSRRLIERVLTRVELPGRGDADDLLALLRRFAADAAREQARAVVADRLHRRPPALPAPVAEPVDAVATIEAIEAAGTDVASIALVAVPVDESAMPAGEDAALSPIDDFDFEGAIAAAALDAIAAEPSRAPDPSPLLAPHDAPAPPRIADELDEPVGLFSHIRLEDVPSDWLDAAGDDATALDVGLGETALRGGLAA